MQSTGINISISLSQDAYKAVRAKSPTFGNDSRCLKQFNGESIMKEQDKLFDSVDYRPRQEQLERQHSIDREEVEINQIKPNQSFNQ